MTVSSITATSPARINTALTILRVAIGIVFLMHGGQKLFIYGHAGVAGAFAGMGVPLPEMSAYIVAPVEFLGGIALILGLFTRIAAVLLAIEMLSAFLLVHIKGGFFLPNGVEFVLTLLAGSLALVLGGSGSLALDNVLASRRSGGATR